MTEKLNKASEFYYNTGDTIMSDAEYDKLLERLEGLEILTGYKLSNSPTSNVGATVLNNLNKVKHVKPMLSLKKCHTSKEVYDFSQGKDLIASIKCDGLTCRLTYENGKLIRAETRGNGIEGVDVTEHVKLFENVPLTIPTTEKYIIDGEAIIPNCFLDEINQKLPKGTESYKNTRNLASGTLNLLDVSAVKDRHMYFIAWDIVEPRYNRLWDAYADIERLGFDLVEARFITGHDTFDFAHETNIELTIEVILEAAKRQSIPCDGVVFKFNDIEFGNSLGSTEHHFNNGIAWKPAMERYKTILRDIEWNTTRSGVINPVAVFDEVDLDGAATTRATLHNVTYIKNLELGIGDEIEVIRSNMVIPRVVENLTRSNTYKFPLTCPCCGHDTEIRAEKDSEVLYCTNDDCPAKRLSLMVNFVSKNGMDIKGLSEATLSDLMHRGYITYFRDIYNLPKYASRLSHMDGMGKRSVEKLLNAIEESKNVDLAHFIAALGIPGVGLGQAKLIADKVKTWEGLEYSRPSDILSINGIGEKIEKSLSDWFDTTYISCHIHELVELMNFTENNKTEGSSLKGKTFVVTGNVEKFKNRNEIKDKIEALGGKVTGSVSAKTDYLVCNESSNSGKYKKAVELNVPIIDEDELIRLIGCDAE